MEESGSEKAGDNLKAPQEQKEANLEAPSESVEDLVESAKKTAIELKAGLEERKKILEREEKLLARQEALRALGGGSSAGQKPAAPIDPKVAEKNARIKKIGMATGAAWAKKMA